MTLAWIKLLGRPRDVVKTADNLFVLFRHPAIVAKLNNSIYSIPLPTIASRRRSQQLPFDFLYPILYN